MKTDSMFPKLKDALLYIPLKMIMYPVKKEENYNHFHVQEIKSNYNLEQFLSNDEINDLNTAFWWLGYESFFHYISEFKQEFHKYVRNPQTYYKSLFYQNHKRLIKYASNKSHPSDYSFTEEKLILIEKVLTITVITIEIENFNQFLLLEDNEILNRVDDVEKKLELIKFRIDGGENHLLKLLNHCKGRLEKRVNGIKTKNKSNYHSSSQINDGPIKTVTNIYNVNNNFFHQTNKSSTITCNSFNTKNTVLYSTVNENNTSSTIVNNKYSNVTYKYLSKRKQDEKSQKPPTLIDEYLNELGLFIPNKKRFVLIIEGLKSIGFIKVEEGKLFDVFSVNESKAIWTKDVKDLYFLFCLLNAFNIVVSIKSYNEIIPLCFLNKNGEDLKVSTLSNIRSQFQLTFETEKMYNKWEEEGTNSNKFIMIIKLFTVLNSSNKV